MNESDLRSPLLIALAVLAGAFFLVALCRPSDPNAELVRTTREAVEMVRDADGSVPTAVIWSCRLRLLAIVLGVSVPMIVAYLIWRSAATSEPDPAEILEQLERTGVANLDSVPSAGVSIGQLPAQSKPISDKPPPK